MLIVQGTFRVDPPDRDAFVAQSVAGMQIARGEQGCLEFVIAADPAEPDRVILSERWESMEDLNEHTRALNRRRRAAASTELGADAESAARTQPAPIAARSRDIAIYEVASVRQMT